MPPVVFVVDADSWTRDLLKSLVLAARADAQVQEFAAGYAALEEWKRLGRCALILFERPADGDGLEWLRRIRQVPLQPLQPVILLSGEADANQVRAALRLAPTAYLAKPYDAEDLLRRLRTLLPAGPECEPVPPAAAGQTVDAYLQRLSGEIDTVPLFADLPAIIERCRAAEDCSLSDLESEFDQDPLVTATLIAAANSAAQHVGHPCQTLTQALPRLGVGHTLNLVLGLSLRRSAHLNHPLLAERAELYLQYAQRAADCAGLLALRYSRADSDRCYTAGLLHRLGELGVLRGLQGFHDEGGEVDGPTMERALARYSQDFAAELQRHWRLPLELRDLMGAVHSLTGVLPKPALILHLAAQAACLETSVAYETLLEHKAARMLGLEPAPWARAIAPLQRA